MKFTSTYPYAPFLLWLALLSVQYEYNDKKDEEIYVLDKGSTEAKHNLHFFGALDHLEALKIIGRFSP